MTTTKIYNRNTHDKDVKPCTFPQFQTVNCDDFIPSYRHLRHEENGNNNKTVESKSKLTLMRDGEMKIHKALGFVQ